MANQKAFGINVTFVSDGTSTMVTFDLFKDPYRLDAEVANWFAIESKSSRPVGTITTNPGWSVSLTNDTLTVTFPPGSFPTAGQVVTVGGIYLLF